MNHTDLIRNFLSILPRYVATLLVSLVAVVVLLTRWKRASRGALWALAGFGLLLFLSLTCPLGQAIIQKWVFQDGDRVKRVWALTAFGMSSSVLYALSNLLLLVAIFAGRSTADEAIPPSSKHQ